MKKIPVALLFFITANAFSQRRLNEMIATEKSFAAYSVANNTRDAFLQFIDTAAIMFDKGEPVNGYQLWRNKPVRPGVLNWRPQFSEVAASGDFGYTCGPWTFQGKTINDSVMANGCFFTIWKKNGEGKWKFIYDGGTDEGPAIADTGVTNITVRKNRSNSATMAGFELLFDTYRKRGDASVYKRFLSSASILCSNKTGLLTTAADQQNFIIKLSAIEYKMLGSGLAPSGDLGFIYGNTFVDGKKDFYLHVWRKQPDGWKLAVELVRY